MNWIRKNMLYARYLFLHKLFVFRAGLITGAPLWRLIIHDYSKLLPHEWVPYREFFYDVRTPRVKEAFDRAWLSHIHWNPHHWDAHILKDNGGWKAIPMPDHFIREMVADWAGAGRAIKGEWEVVEWYAKNQSMMLLHPHTKFSVEKYLSMLDKELRKMNHDSAITP